MKWSSLEIIQFVFLHTLVYVFVSNFVFVFVFGKHDVLGVVAVVGKCLREMGRDWRQSSRQSTGEVSQQFREKKHLEKAKRNKLSKVARVRNCHLIIIWASFRGIDGQGYVHSDYNIL